MATRNRLAVMNTKPVGFMIVMSWLLSEATNKIISGLSFAPDIAD